MRQKRNSKQILESKLKADAAAAPSPTRAQYNMATLL